jgi:hypothetical protein
VKFTWLQTWRTAHKQSWLEEVSTIAFVQTN